MLSDAKRPSVVSLVIGGPAKGSWWSHPKGREIYALLEQLGQHPDLLAVKLIEGKVTFVHRRLWPAVLAIARARDDVQMKGLSPAARRLLARVDEKGEVEAHGPVVKELESRLLVHAAQLHTKSGAHTILLTSWPLWTERHAPVGRAVPLARARKLLDTRPGTTS